MLIWDQHEFVECLGVLPSTDEDETYHTFRIEKDGLRLELTVFQYGGHIYFDLYRESVEPSILKIRLVDCAGTRYVSDKNGLEYLEFSPSKSLGYRHDGESPIPFGVRVAANPHIRIELF